MKPYPKNQTSRLAGVEPVPAIARAEAVCAPRDGRDIPDALDALGAMAQVLADDVRKLSERLEPACLQQPPEAACEAQPEPYRSVVASRIHGTVQLLGHLRAVVSSLESRVQL